MTVQLEHLNEWQALQAHYEQIKHQTMRQWFQQHPKRAQSFSLKYADLTLDYSRNRATEKTLQLLVALAKKCDLATKIEQLFMGASINSSERRPALHTQLRDLNHAPLYVQNRNIASDIQSALRRLDKFVDQIHQGMWRGITGKPIKHVVNIGIGGSYIGPMMASEALKDFAINDLKLYFVSTVDKVPLEEIQQQIDPERTLFIISSKSFTTIETLTNTKTFLAWMQEKFGPNVIAQHFVAITAKPEKARAYGLPEDNIFPIWDWVGGRYSVWSAIALPLILLIGQQQFRAFLAGANDIDNHFKSAPFVENLPVLLGLLSIWYVNFFAASAYAIVPYAHRLRYFIPYLQQVEMESNGKSTNRQGKTLSYATSPVIFGEEGCRGQHAYHQLLHQGQHLIPVDFILIKPAQREIHADILLASAISQAEALMRGKTYEEAYQSLKAANVADMEAKQLALHQIIPGNRPSNILWLAQLTPRSLGQLIALYEHRIFVQSAIWDINVFDQWGVELGKQLLPNILQTIQQAKLDGESDVK